MAPEPCILNASRSRSERLLRRPHEPNAELLTEFRAQLPRLVRDAIARAADGPLDLHELDSLIAVLTGDLADAWAYIHEIENHDYEDRREHDVAIGALAIGSGFDPRGCFVYLLFGDDPLQPIYIGQSTNVLNRLGQHMVAIDRRHRITRVDTIRCATPQAMHRLEENLIKRYQPELNRALLRDKVVVDA